MACLVHGVCLPGRGIAQEPVHSVAMAAGSGLSIATGQRGGVMQRTPILIDLAYRFWNSEDPRVVWGGSARVEVEGRASFAVVPRVEYTATLGALTLRPGLAAPLFIAPFTLIGVEGSVTARVALADNLGLLGVSMVTAYLRGSDLPDDSVLLMFNGMLGVDLVF